MEQDEYKEMIFDGTKEECLWCGSDMNDGICISCGWKIPMPE